MRRRARSPRCPTAMAEDTLGKKLYSKLGESGEEVEEEGEGDAQKKYLVGEDEEKEEQDDQEKYHLKPHDDDDEEDEDDKDEDFEFGQAGIEMNPEEKQRIAKEKEEQEAEQRQLNKIAAQAKLQARTDRIQFCHGAETQERTNPGGSFPSEGAFGETVLLESSESGQPPLVLKTPLAESRRFDDLQRKSSFTRRSEIIPTSPSKCVGVMDVDGQPRAGAPRRSRARTWARPHENAQGSSTRPARFRISNTGAAPKGTRCGKRSRPIAHLEECAHRSQRTSAWTTSCAIKRPAR